MLYYEPRSIHTCLCPTLASIISSTFHSLIWFLLLLGIQLSTWSLQLSHEGATEAGTSRTWDCSGTEACRDSRARGKLLHGIWLFHNVHLVCLRLYAFDVYTRRIDGRMPNRLAGMPCKSIHWSLEVWQNLEVSFHHAWIHLAVKLFLEWHCWLLE